jgi:hypothetical protein
LPHKGMMPCRLSTAQLSGVEVKPITRKGPGVSRAKR